MHGRRRCTTFGDDGMAHNFKSLELRVPESVFGLSARRLREHTELGQFNVLGHAISRRPGHNDPLSSFSRLEFFCIPHHRAAQPIAAGTIR